MAKSLRTAYRCRECGAQTARWEGRCPSCQAWNSLEETVAAPARSAATKARQPALGIDLASLAVPDTARLNLGLAEIDRVLGGGLVSGSLILLAGDPGIGKSTLLLQVAEAVAKRTGKPVAYVSSEESAHQLRLRSLRLGVSGEGIRVLAETDLEAVLASLEGIHPAALYVDSIQAIRLGDDGPPAGSVAQVRECAARLMEWAKTSNTAAFITGHVTKEGAVAGPKTLEHLVDVVLYLEGDPFGHYRLLRCTKNRFGATNEVGVFEMRDSGLAGVANPSALFISHRNRAEVGSAVVPTLEGTRPLLVEVQALVNPTPFSAPRRTASGIDFNRLLIITAVLSRRAGIPLGSQDVIVKVTGGLDLREPAADLAVALAIASSHYDAPLKPGTVAVGEIGLSGELRPVSAIDRRLAEAAKLGFSCAIVPEAAPIEDSSGIHIVRAVTLRQAIRLALPPTPKGREAVPAERVEEPDTPPSDDS